MLTQTPTPAIYRTTISHSRRATVHHSFEYRSYSWYVDVDDLPRLPWWLRPFARFQRRRITFQILRATRRTVSLRDRLDAFFADHDWPCPRAASPRCCRRASSVMFSTR